MKTNIDQSFNLESTHLVETNKLFHEVKDIFSDSTGIDPNEIMYKVQMIESGSQKFPGSLRFGITHLYSKNINGEFNMTRGHIHQDLSCDEYYECVSGNGILMLVDEKFEVSLESMHPGSIHYINGKYAHRCINTGLETLVFKAVWSPAAGYDYDTVPFNVRIMKEDNTFKIEGVYNEHRR